MLKTADCCSQGKEIAGCHKNVNVYSSFPVAFEMMMRIFVISANGGILCSAKSLCLYVMLSGK